MTEPKYATTTEQGRTYEIPTYEGVEFTSVTTVLKVISKPALLPWGIRMCAERAVNQEAEWHAIQQEEGNDAALKWLKGASSEYAGDAATVGSALHWMAENFNGSCDFKTYDEDVIGRLRWYANQTADPKATAKRVQKHLEQYARFIDQWNPTFLIKERLVFDPIRHYAGTLDGVLLLESGTYIFDIKTGGVYEEAALQLAAYRHAGRMVEDGVPVALDFNFVGGLVLQVKADYFKVHRVECGPEVHAGFLAALDLYRWQEQNKRVIEVWK